MLEELAGAAEEGAVDARARDIALVERAERRLEERVVLLDPEGPRDQGPGAITDHRGDDVLVQRLEPMSGPCRVAGEGDIAPGVDDRAVQVEEERRGRDEGRDHVRPNARCRRSIMREMNGVKISCIASSMR